MCWSSQGRGERISHENEFRFLTWLNIFGVRLFWQRSILMSLHLSDHRLDLLLVEMIKSFQKCPRVISEVFFLEMIKSFQKCPRTISEVLFVRRLENILPSFTETVVWRCSFFLIKCKGLIIYFMYGRKQTPKTQSYVLLNYRSHLFCFCCSVLDSWVSMELAKRPLLRCWQET